MSEICVNRFDDIFVKRLGKMVHVENRFRDEDELKTLISQIANHLDQTVDDVAHPILDARLPDGTRVCAVLYPTATNGTCATFRLFPKHRIDGAMLIENQTLTAEMLAFIERAVICRANILISGSTDSGKTTLLNVMSEFIPPEDRVLTVEDTKELKISSKNHISLEAPSRDRGNHQENQHVTMAKLIETCLRKNPTRIIVGEIRDKKAAVAFLHSINTGHTASSTVHANSAEDALNRIQILSAEDGGLPFAVIEKQVRGNLHILIHAEETVYGRKVVEIKEIISGHCSPLWEFSYQEKKHVKINKSQLLKKMEGKY